MASGGGRVSSFAQSGSLELTVLAVVVCVVLAQGQDDETLGVMAAFFDVMADVLALFALQPGLCGTSRAPQETGGAI